MAKFFFFSPHLTIPPPQKNYFFLLFFENLEKQKDIVSPAQVIDC